MSQTPSPAVSSDIAALQRHGATVEVGPNGNAVGAVLREGNIGEAELDHISRLTGLTWLDRRAKL